MRNKMIVWLWLGIVAMPGFVSRLHADERADLLKHYLTDDVVAVAYFDLEKLEPIAIANLFQSFGVEGAELANLSAAMEQSKIELENLKAAGIRQIYVLLRTSDLNELGTSWVVPVAEGKDVRQAMEVIKKLIAKANLGKLIGQLQAGDGAVLAAGNLQQLKRLAEEQPKQSRDLSAAWGSLGSGSCGLLVFGDSDSRRVLSELIPNLPAPFESITGKMVADELKWAGLELSLPPNLNLKLQMEAENPETAAAVAKAISSAVETLAMIPQFKTLLPQEQDQQMLRDALKPVVKQNRISVSLDAVTGDLDRLSQLAAGPVREMRNAARMQAEMNQVRQFALAIHNYESANRQFPNPSGKTKQTPAGLSWRVQVLPYIEQGELYKQFKLDEPWDSEQNLKFVNRMPAIFKSPLVQNQSIHTAGKTIYQVPVSVEGIFKPNNDGTVGVTFKDIKDGSSNTILIVTVAESDAAIWTKPDDWEVDLADPWKGLRDDSRKSVVVSLADGSNHALPVTLSPGTLRALITSSGGEVTPWPWK